MDIEPADISVVVHAAESSVSYRYRIAPEIFGDVLGGVTVGLRPLGRGDVLDVVDACVARTVTCFLCTTRPGTWETDGPAMADRPCTWSRRSDLTNDLSSIIDTGVVKSGQRERVALKLGE
jgi:hypothetical protein